MEEDTIPKRAKREGHRESTKSLVGASAMSTKQLTLQERLTACAGATVHCLHLRADGKPEPEKTPSETGERRCNACVDQAIPGRVYFLGNKVRLHCPCLRAYDGINHYLDATDGFRCCKRFLYDEGKEGNDCHCCQGRSWVPNPDQDAWRRVLRALGWEMKIEMHLLGDAIEIEKPNGNLAFVRPREGLHDFPAFATVLKRALEQQGVEMGI